MLLIQASGDSSKKYFPLAKMVYSSSERADVTALFIKLKLSILNNTLQWKCILEKENLVTNKIVVRAKLWLFTVTWTVEHLSQMVAQPWTTRKVPTCCA